MHANTVVCDIGKKGSIMVYD